jgi:hypothetical protein
MEKILFSGKDHIFFPFIKYGRNASDCRILTDDPLCQFFQTGIRIFPDHENDHDLTGIMGMLDKHMTHDVSKAVFL